MKPMLSVRARPILSQPCRLLSFSVVRHQKQHEHKDSNSHTHTERIDEHGHEHEHEHKHEHGMKSMLTHSHSHGGGNPLLTFSKEQMLKNPGVRITWIGLGSNVLMAVGKFFGGIAFHSQALLADSVHAMSDLVSDFLTLFSVSLSSRKPNDQYPYGYGKVETVGSLAVSTILAGAGVSIGWASLCAIVGPMIPHTIIESLSSILGTMVADGTASQQQHSHTHIAATTDINAAWIAAGSIVLKEWIFQATRKVAIRTNSNVLMVNAWHHRIDSLTSLVALAAITSSHFFGIQSLDDLGGLLVSVLIIKAGAEGMITAVKELTDQAIPSTDNRYIYVQDLLAKHARTMEHITVTGITVMPMGPKLRAIATLAFPQETVHVKDIEHITKHLTESMLSDPRIAFFDVRFTEAPQDSSNK